MNKHALKKATTEQCSIETRIIHNIVQLYIKHE